MSAKDNNDGDKVTLSYHDCLVRNHDVDLLRGPHWLNDAIIGFYFEYLQHKVCGESKQILLVSPELTQLLKLTDAADYSAFLEPLDAKQYHYVLFPLNNCESRSSAGGTHWSLLVYSKKERTAFHLDSCGGTNRLVAAQFAKKIMKYLSETGAKDFEELQCPQQENGYDCGLFTLCLADSIIQKIHKSLGIRDCDFDDVTNRVRTMREELLSLIQHLKLCKDLLKPLSEFEDEIDYLFEDGLQE